MEEEKNGLQLESKKTYLKNIDRELELIATQRPDVQSKKDLLLKEMANVKRRGEIIISKYKKLKIDWEFEEDPEYLDLMKEFEIILFDKKQMDYNNALKQLDANLDAMDKQEASQVEAKEKVLKEIAELEKSD